jgi:hypothetical protein
MLYTIDSSVDYDEGGYCQFYPIKNNPDLAFKEFYSIEKAIFAASTQTKLSLYELAPKIFTELCQLKFSDSNEVSGWGYVTEIAFVPQPRTIISMRQIQYLVGKIYQKTGLKFWDCHWSNIGLIKRKGKSKVVCIDTGKESFDGYANAWGMNSPGPKCGYCNKYQCRCSEV